MTKMDCNKDEAIRAKELAEKKLAEMDAVGAKRFALKAQNLYPGLDGLPQLLATLDVYISADKKINGEVDWYRVLAVQPFADGDTIRKHYRKLALVLHPDKNKSVGADGAFKILSQAWNLLSDKAKRIAYDQKRNLRGSYTNVPHGKSSSSAMTSPNGFHKFSDENISNISGWNGATYSKPAPRTVRNDTFWTTCNSCKMHFEYSRVYINVNLPCINCRTHFFAVETPAPAINASNKYTPFSDFIQQQKFRQAHNAGYSRFSGISTKISQKGGFPRSGSNINVSSPASFTNEATGVTHSAGETLKSAHNKSQTDITITRGKNLQMKCHPSQKTDAGLGTGSSASVSSFAAKKHRPKKRRIDETEMVNHSAMGNERVSFSSFQKSGFDSTAGMYRTNSIKQPSQLGIRNILMELAKKEINKKLNSWKPASLSAASNKPKAFDEGINDKDEGNGKDALSMNSGAHESMKFVGIKSSIEPKRSYTDDSHVNPATKELDPLSMNVPAPDFHDFDLDRTEKSFGDNQWSKGRKGAIRIYPRKRDVWALYSNWSTDWIELTPDEVIHSYDMVQVLEDYNEQNGVAVAPLVKFPGFKTVFRQHYEQSKTWMIPREELFRFSHQVPSCLLTGQEGLNAPKDCLELDPAAIPLDLLQVLTEAQVKEMEVITETVQETKPNIQVEYAGQPVIKEEVKKENEKKKPRMLVYGRRQQRKREA
ncbi:uncharacterized protein LOC120140133 [Hibiscus syriacus]|uniref:uncharacterized protein LOC120140133 n=1 Tax=Hibiscus syriacus TaxID=106335 RepID=UPI00192432CA|nr:uncharacterized protein LOC120140133 [Hibiscus syriacus]